MQGVRRRALRGVPRAGGCEERVEMVFLKITVRCQTECRLAQHPHFIARYAVAAAGVEQSGELEGGVEGTRLSCPNILSLQGGRARRASSTWV